MSGCTAKETVKKSNRRNELGCKSYTEYSTQKYLKKEDKLNSNSVKNNTSSRNKTRLGKYSSSFILVIVNKKSKLMK